MWSEVTQALENTLWESVVYTVAFFEGTVKAGGMVRMDSFLSGVGGDL